MKPSLVARSLKAAINADRPVMLYGSPGIGKSDIVRQVCADLGYIVEDIRVSQMDPVDIRGVPIVDHSDRSTHFSKPAWWPKPGVKTCLFWDELNSGSPAVQAATYQIILDRKLGEHTLPPGTIQIAAGNNMSDGGLVNVMPTPLKNRFVHIDVEVNNDEWCQWAVQTGIRPEIIALIRFKPTLLNEFGVVNAGEQLAKDKKDKKHRVSHRDMKAFATPRTWAFCSDIMTTEPPEDVAFDLYSGCVGEGAAIELKAHIEVHTKLPRFEDIIKKPATAPVPKGDQPAVLYSLATSLASKADEKNFNNILEYGERLPTEFNVMLVKDALIRNRALSQVSGFRAFANKHADLLV